jgi:hypothetical protein
MLEGVYAETGPISIGSSVRIEGGYRDAGATWMTGGDDTRIEVSGTRDGLLAPQTEMFNLSGKPGSAVVAVAGGLDVTLVDVEVAAVGQGSLLSSSRCTAVIQVAGSSLVLERTTVRMARLAAEDACVAGVFAVNGIGLDPRLSIYDSDIPGFAPEGIVAVPQGLELAGVAMTSGETLVVEGSTIAALTAPGLTFDPGDLSAAGLAVGSADYIELRRSDLLAVDQPADLRVFGSGVLTGAELRANVTIAADDSVFRTPTGGTQNNALVINSTPGGVNVANLVHITAIAGTDWDLSDAPALPFEGAALRIAGSIDVLHVVNSIFSYAGGASSSPSVRWTGIDLSARDELPTEFAFQGNIVSTPKTQWHPNAEGSLVFCRPRTVDEFANAYTQEELQHDVAYTCGGQVPDTSRWNTGQNIALTEAPDPSRSDLHLPLPWCAAFGIDGYPDGYASEALPQLSPPPLGSSGVVIGSLPYVVEAAEDRPGRSRDRSNREPAGAWLPLIEIDPPLP